MSRFLSYSVAYLSIVLLGVSCTTSFPGGVCDIDSGTWYSGLNQDVKLPNNDTLSMRKLIVFLKYDNTFDAKRVKFALKTTSPSGLNWIDTITLTVPKTATKATDSEYQQSYRNNVTLKESGDYRVRFTLLSPDSISGVNAIGVNVK